jgi:hypothetical protein
MNQVIQSAVDAFFSAHEPDTVRLILDSTGPSLTKHYLAMNAIGLERLAALKEIHSFSGGTFAWFGFHAAATGSCRHELTEYYSNLDHHMRLAHASSLGNLPIVTALPQVLRWIKEKTFYESSEPIEKVIQYVFSDALLTKEAKSIAPNFTSWYTGPDGNLIPWSSQAQGHSDEIQTVFDVVRHAVAIPFLYGRKRSLSDPAFAKGYGRTLKLLTSDKVPTLMVTPWREGQKGNTLFLNPFRPNNQKLVMTRDIACLLLNIPNRSYGRDLKEIFG